MKLLKNLCNSAISNHELLIDAEDRISLESEYLLMQYILTKDISEHGLSLLGGTKKLDIEQYLAAVLHTKTIGPIKMFTPLEVRFIVRSRILTWLAGGSGVSLDTLDLILEHKRYVNFVPALAKDYPYEQGDVKPAAQLLDYILDFADVRESFPETDILPFTSGNFVQIGYAASLMERIDKVWSLYMYSTFVSSVVLNSNNHNYHLKPGTYSDAMGEILNTLLLINPANKDSEDIAALQAIPQQIHSYLISAQCYAEAIEQSLTVPVGNLAFCQSGNGSLSQPAPYNLNMVECIIDLLDNLKVMGNAIIDRTEYMLSGQMEGLANNDCLSDEKCSLAAIPQIMSQIKSKVTDHVLLVRMKSSRKDDLGAVMECASALEHRLEAITDLIKTELFAQAHIYEKTESVATRINQLHEKHVPFNTLLFARYKLDGDKSFEEFMDYADQEHLVMWNNEFYAKHSLRSIYIG